MHLNLSYIHIRISSEFLERLGILKHDFSILNNSDLKNFGSTWCEWWRWRWFRSTISLDKCLEYRWTFSINASLAEGSSSPTSAISLAVKVSAIRGARDCIKMIPGPVNLRNNSSKTGNQGIDTRSPMKVRRLQVTIRCQIRANIRSVSVDLISLMNSLWYNRDGMREGIWIRKGRAERRWGCGDVVLIVYANKWLPSFNLLSNSGKVYLGCTIYSSSSSSGISWINPLPDNAATPRPVSFVHPHDGNYISHLFSVFEAHDFS